MELNELLERLEKAEGPDFDLDVDIQKTFFGEKDWLELCRSYTSSLDAAVALCEQVLPGWEWTIDRARSCTLEPPGYDFRLGKGLISEDGATPALALCTALVRALMETKDGQVQRHHR